MFQKKTDFIENNLNRKSKILELTIYLYRCYYEHEAPRSYNSTVYLSHGKALKVKEKG